MWTQPKLQVLICLVKDYNKYKTKEPEGMVGNYINHELDKVYDDGLEVTDVWVNDGCIVDMMLQMDPGSNYTCSEFNVICVIKYNRYEKVNEHPYIPNTDE